MGGVVLKDVEKSFGDVVVCSRVDLAIKSGEFFTLLGPSGCGKTTILRLIAGFITPNRGSILLDGKDITHVPAEKRNVGMVFQNYALFPHLSVYRNIEYGLALQKRPTKQVKAAIAHYMEMTGLKGLENRAISELSGGEQQRVALARSLAVEPRVLLLDEPLSNLDARLRGKMRQEIKSLQRALGITTVFVTHDQTEALTLSDRIAVLDKGRVVQTGDPQDIYDHPATSFVAGFIGDANLFKASFNHREARFGADMRVQLSRPAPDGKFISIRPQDIMLSAIPLDGPNVFQGRIEEVQLNGVWIDYLLEVDGTPLRAAALNSVRRRQALRRGDTVFLSIPEDAGAILAR
ncbi:MAG: ABC transporter ATP-binding protein [Pseudomonadota bacterium]